MILVVDSSSEMPSQTDYGDHRSSVGSDAGTNVGSDLERKSLSESKEIQPIRNIVLTGVRSTNKLNETLECDDEDNEDCAINKFSLEGIYSIHFKIH
jgi:hypothetical protein